MKLGFRIDIQSDLNENEMKIAQRFADDFIIRTLQDPKKRYGGHGSGKNSPYNRGKCMCLDGGNLNFRRINRHKRIFAVSKMDIIDDLDGYGKLKFKNNIVPLMFVYAQIGDIKG
jgi:hypothetical protein